MKQEEGEDDLSLEEDYDDYYLNLEQQLIKGESGKKIVERASRIDLILNKNIMMKSLY